MKKARLVVSEAEPSFSPGIQMPREAHTSSPYFGEVLLILVLFCGSRLLLFLHLDGFDRDAFLSAAEGPEHRRGEGASSLQRAAPFVRLAVFEDSAGRASAPSLGILWRNL